VAGGVVGAALLAGLMSAAGGADATASIGAGLDTAVSQSTVDAETASSQEAAKTGDDTEAWRRLALKEIKKDVKRELRCAVQSFGQVQQFFLRHPCDKLDQLLFAISDTHGDIVVGTVMWVTMPSDSEASEFKQLEDTYGTGDVTPVGTQILQLGGIRFSGKHYKSRSDGSLVVISEAEPARGQPSNMLLQEVATISDVLPPP
jgi:hypothetical protein